MLGNWWDSEAVLAQLSTKDWEKVTVNIKEWGATSAGVGGSLLPFIPWEGPLSLEASVGRLRVVGAMSVLLMRCTECQQGALEEIHEGEGEVLMSLLENSLWRVEEVE